ncbi:MAG: hypothetical protein HY866_12415, partial [Chloroflexi bacterium]|nr:hypothetical protein [Chloroflexota bacterium]
TSRPFGAVNLFGRRAADQIIDLMGEVAYLIKKPEPLRVPAAMPPAPAPEVEEVSPARRKKRRTVEAEAVVETPKPQPASPLMEPVGDMDLDALFGQSVDEGMAESLFDLDNLTDIAASLESDEGKKVGYDEAIDMGILEK